MSRNDVTVTIPMASEQNNGARAPSVPKSKFSIPQYTSSNEKSGVFRRNNGRRKVGSDQAKNRNKTKRGPHGEEEIITRMGRIYSKFFNFSLATRYFIYVLPLALLIAVPIIVGATAAKKVSFGGVRMVWIFTWVEIIWLSLWVSKLFASYTPYLFQFLCGIVSSGTRKYAAVLGALEIPMSLVGWAVTAWATFIPLMTCNPQARASNRGNCASHQHWQDVVSSVFAAFLVASIIYLAEKVLVQLISISYHRKQFDHKIKTSKHNVWLLSLLYEASRALFPAYCNEFSEEDYLISDSLAVGSSDHPNHHQSGSATPMRLVQNIGRVGDKITAVFGNVAQEITGKDVFNPTAAHSIVVEALEKHSSSEALAKRLWMSFVVEGKEALYRDDLIEVLGTGRRDEAEEAFDAIDADGNGDISLDEMIAAVVQFGRERHLIANSVHDVDQAIKVLDKLLQVIVFVLIVLVFVGFLNSSFTTTAATAGTALLSMSFVFASTAAEVLGSCIFLFVKHPYDVGDRVDISKQQLTVEHISLLFSVFRRVDNHKLVQIPNTVLNQNWIENISRSKAMRERVNMYISFDTSLDDINALKAEMEKFVTSKENNRDFQSDIEVEIIGIAEMNKLELQVEIRHKSNWSNETLRATRRSKFMCALVLALRKVPIYAPGGGDAALGDLGKPTYSVSISDAEAAARRDAFAATKEAKRMIPSKKPDPVPEARPDVGKTLNMGSKDNLSLRPSTGEGSEKTAVDALHNRDPGSDAARDDWDSYREELGMGGAGRSSDESELEEVRGLLRRQSTRGRRKPAPPRKPSVSIIAESPITSAIEKSLPRLDSVGASQRQEPPARSSPSPEQMHQMAVDEGETLGSNSPKIRSAQPAMKYPPFQPATFSSAPSASPPPFAPGPLSINPPTPTTPPPPPRKQPSPQQQPSRNAFAQNQHPLQQQPQQPHELQLIRQQQIQLEQARQQQSQLAQQQGRQPGGRQSQRIPRRTSYVPQWDQRPS